MKSLVKVALRQLFPLFNHPFRAINLLYRWWILKNLEKCASLKGKANRCQLAATVKGILHSFGLFHEYIMFLVYHTARTPQYLSSFSHVSFHGCPRHPLLLLFQENSMGVGWPLTIKSLLERKSDFLLLSSPCWLLLICM